MAKTRQVPNDQKFRELILYIAKESAGDASFGATKLNKLLFFCDFLAYRKFGKSISGQPYQKLENGPAPKTLLPILKKMASRGSIATAERDYFGRKQKVTVALRDPDLSDFDPQEIELVNEVIKTQWNTNATAISDLSHDFVGWKAAKMKEVIPYGTVFINENPETNASIRRKGRQLESLAKRLSG